MVDTKARRRAAEVVEKFRDGVITNFEFEGAWPSYSRHDRGMRAIETMLWCSYDDFKEHKLTGEYGLTDEGRDLFDRCVLFLRTELEYCWAADDFISSARAPATNLITLNLDGPPPDPMLDWEGRRLQHLHVIGDDPFWPFFTQAEYDQHRAPDISAPHPTGGAPNSRPAD